MKPWMSVLVSAAVAVGAVAIYDQIRASDAPAGTVSIVSGADLNEIEERLARLEAKEGPLLAGRGEQAILSRIESLERHRRALEGQTSPVPEPTAHEEDAVGDLAALDLLKPEGELSPEAVERFRKLRGAAHREDRSRYRQEQVATALAKLELSLTESQQNQLAEKLEAFQPRRNALWGEAKSLGRDGAEVDWPRVIQETQATIQREFAESISEIVPYSADASQLSSVLVGSTNK